MKTRRSFGVSPSPNSEQVAATRGGHRSGLRSGLLSARGSSQLWGWSENYTEQLLKLLDLGSCLNRDPAFGACVPPFLQWWNSVLLQVAVKELVPSTDHVTHTTPISREFEFDCFGNEFDIFITEFRASFHHSQPKTLNQQEAGAKYRKMYLVRQRVLNCVIALSTCTFPDGLMFL